MISSKVVSVPPLSWEIQGRMELALHKYTNNQLAQAAQITAGLLNEPLDASIQRGVFRLWNDRLIKPLVHGVFRDGQAREMRKWIRFLTHPQFQSYGPGPYIHKAQTVLYGWTVWQMAVFDDDVLPIDHPAHEIFESLYEVDRCLAAQCWRDTLDMFIKQSGENVRLGEILGWIGLILQAAASHYGDDFTTFPGAHTYALKQVGVSRVIELVATGVVERTRQATILGRISPTLFSELGYPSDHNLIEEVIRPMSREDQISLISDMMDSCSGTISRGGVQVFTLDPQKAHRYLNTREDSLAVELVSHLLRSRDTQPH